MSLLPPPPFAAFTPPPLPPGWTQHTAPGGQPYYYNAQTKESTYVRPAPHFGAAPSLPQTQQKKKKEKPLAKTPIPGTDWLRVKTTEGNVFYTHKVEKESVWTVPYDIRDEVAAIEHEEREQAERAEQERMAAEEERKKAEAKRAEEERLMEVERIRMEVQDMVKRKADDAEPVDQKKPTKKAKVEEVRDSDDRDSDESEEEEWQREAAAQLAAEAEEEARRREKEEQERKEQEEAEKRRVKEAIPDQVNLSIEEGKALFKTLLREKDINPLHPWDTSLPLFISDPRYVLLPTLSARREAFDEYCRDRARELRQSKVKEQKETLSPKEEFDRLLSTEVKSTRTSWSDFRRAWKKDRRFYGWGRDDKEREKRFKEYLKDLGEKKRAAAKKAEEDFFALLKEHCPYPSGAAWKDVKKAFVKDPRYDAVGSSSLREELFNTFMKATGTSTNGESASKSQSSRPDEQQKTESKQERKERAVREREDKVRAEKERLEARIGRSKQGLNKEEDEQAFLSLLTDAIRDPQATWDTALPELQIDPRFQNSTLPINQRQHLFRSHIGRLRAKHINNLHTLFESYAPSLATKFDDLPIPSLMSSLPVTKLGYGEARLEDEFKRWQRERTQKARTAFDEMLTENSFVEFWGRLGKIGGEGAEGGVKLDDEGMAEDEGEGGGGRVDMKALAKNVDVKEMVAVLKNDKRYIMFEHIPEQREQWLRDYLAQLSAPKLSVHIPS